MKVWIFLDGRQQGPFELEELLDMPVNENTKVWFEGLPKWYPAGYLSEMRPLFDGTLSRAETEHNAPTQCPPPVPHVTTEVIEDTVVPEIPADADIHHAAEPVHENVITPEPCPPSYLVWGIVLTICCCSPFAIGVIIASICVGNYYARGNYEKARKASEWAQWLIMITLALGIIPMVLMAIFL